MMRFLAIDDNAIDLLIAKAVVHKFNADFDIVTAASADEGLHYLKNNPEQLPDIILLDLNMPQKSGWDFLQEYKTLEVKSSKIYILTSSVNEAEKIMADDNALVTGFLSKPLKIDSLQRLCSYSNLSILK